MAGSFKGSSLLIAARELLIKRLTKKSLAKLGTETCRRPEVETENLAYFENLLRRTIISPNSLSFIIIILLDWSKRASAV